jgi:hypothetical protein
LYLSAMERHLLLPFFAFAFGLRMPNKRAKPSRFPSLDKVDENQLKMSPVLRSN